MKNKLILFGVLLLAVLLYAGIVWQGHNGVAGLYDAKSFRLLNALSGGKGEQSVDFYIWRIEENVLGPAKMLISGMAFALIGALYLQNAGTWAFFLWVFGFLILTRPEVLFYPPYGDAIGGPFVEATWLLRHNFDYVGLSKQPVYVLGGPKVYLFSLFPTYIALMLKLFKDPKVFLVINHLVFFGWGALVIAYFRKILQKVCSPRLAFFMSIGVMAMPLFQAQVEALNMEMPMVCFAMIGMYHLTEKNIGRAAVFSIVAAMVKGVAILICGTVVAVALFLFFFGDKEDRFRFKYPVWAVVTLTFLVTKWLLASHFLSYEGGVPWVGLFMGWPSISSFTFSYLFAASFLVFMFVCVRGRFWGGEDLKISFAAYLKKHFVAFVMFGATIAWYTLFLQTFAVSPRYWLLLAPFNSFCIFYAAQLVIRNEKILTAGLLAFMALGWLNSYGLFYKTFPENDHVILERSLEYRNDLRVSMDVVRKIEENFSGFQIVAPFIQAQMLAMPEMCYVKKPLDVYMYEWSATYAGIKDYPGMKELNVFSTIYFGVKFKQKYIPGDTYPVSKKDKVINEVQYGDKKGWIFMGGYSVDSVLRAKRMLYINQLRQKGK